MQNAKSEVVADQDVMANVEQLRREHHELDERVHQLERKAWRSPDEEMELARMKKLKLAKKDRIEMLTHPYHGSA